MKLRPGAATSHKLGRALRQRQAKVGELTMRRELAELLLENRWS
jgi:hypothetical protein